MYYRLSSKCTAKYTKSHIQVQPNGWRLKVWPCFSMWNFVVVVAGPRWEDQQAMYIGLRYPEDRKKRKRRKQSRVKAATGSGPSSDSTAKQCEHGVRSHVRSLYTHRIYLFISPLRLFAHLPAGCNVRLTLRRCPPYFLITIKPKLHYFDLSWICCTTSCTTNQQQLDTQPFTTCR